MIVAGTIGHTGMFSENPFKALYACQKNAASPW